MDPAEIYATCRRRLLDLATTLSPAQTDALLPATPPWTVLDGYRHLAGVCANVLDGEMGDAPTTAWSAAQLAARADRSLAEVATEWATRGPDLDAQIAVAGTALGFVALDAWTHGQDIRAAAGLPTDHHDPLLPGLVDLALANFGRFYVGQGGPPLRLVIDGEELTLGDGDPSLTLTASAYELMRIIFGRRSEAQIAAASWSSDSAAARTAIHLFDPPPIDLTD